MPSFGGGILELRREITFESVEFMKKRGGVMLAVVLGAVVTAAAFFALSGPDYGDRVFVSNGERIYFTGENALGEKIARSGGILFFDSPACAKCHGENGEGKEADDIPEITWLQLTSVEAHSHDGGTADEQGHPVYTEESLKNAITEGFKPNGDELNDRMPRWQLPFGEVNDLVEYIKTL